MPWINCRALGALFLWQARAHEPPPGPVCSGHPYHAGSQLLLQTVPTRSLLRQPCIPTPTDPKLALPLAPPRSQIQQIASLPLFRTAGFLTGQAEVQRLSGRLKGPKRRDAGSNNPLRLPLLRISKMLAQESLPVRKLGPAPSAGGSHAYRVSPSPEA